MIDITIRAFAKFRELFGAETPLSVSEGSTVAAALQQFGESLPEAREELFDGDALKGHVVLMYNRERIDAEDAEDIVLADGDEIVLYPPVSGG